MVQLERTTIYINALNAHDWFYQMSDDNRVFIRGEAQSNQIKKLISEMNAQELEIAEKIWLMVAPIAPDGDQFRFPYNKPIEDNYQVGFVVLWNKAKHFTHDASGCTYPELWSWKKAINNVWYPDAKEFVNTEQYADFIKEKY